MITGGAGFIGSAVARHLINNTPHQVCVIDKLSYAGNLENLSSLISNPHFEFHCIDVCDRAAVDQVLADVRPDILMHLAAESHVDRSIDGPAPFIQTNLIGTFILLEASRSHWQTLSDSARKIFRFHHVSTDEVYGSLDSDGFFVEASPYRPNSPYSASKAGSDHLVRAWGHTYGLPVVTSNCSNNYGPHQFPEKLIPLTILNAIDGRPLPVYGDGSNVRDWLFVDDHADALTKIALEGQVGQTYLVGGNSPLTNLHIVTSICRILDEIRPLESGSHSKLITYVKDRPGHDLRYAVNSDKIRRELRWSPRENFDSGLRKTIQWYLTNTAWVQSVLIGDYQRARIGLGS